MGQDYSQNEFNINMAKVLVESCLEEDYLYYKFLEPIKNLDDYHFEELFKGNTDIKYDINNSKEFTKLVYKFSDYKKILFHYHKNQSTHQKIIKLWKANICIFELYDLSEDERKKIFKGCGIDYKFIHELNYFLSNTLEGKSESIFDFFKNEMKDLFSILSFSMNEENNLKNNPKQDNQNGTFASNLSNIIDSLIVTGLPMIKMYLDKLPTFDSLSKKELANKDVLARFMIKNFRKKAPNSKFHKTLLEITKDFKNSKAIRRALYKIKNFYSSPMVSFGHLAISLLNLVHSIKSFTDCRNEFKQDKKIYSRKLSKIYTDFLRHKEELKILDLTQIEKCIETVKTIHKKIINDKNNLKKFLKEVNDKITNSKRRKKKAGVCLAINCLTFLACAGGALFTGGATFAIYVGAVCLNGAAITINSINISNINKNLNEYNKFIQEGIELENEINTLLDEIEKKMKLYIDEN